MKSLLGVMVALSLIVMVHEFGHYAAMRTIGVPAEEVAIGMGPEILELGTLGDGAKFRLRAVPFGGYVRSKGLGELYDKGSYGLLAACWVAIAGPLANMLLVFPIMFLVATREFGWRQALSKALSVPVISLALIGKLCNLILGGVFIRPVATVLSFRGPIYILFGRSSLMGGDEDDESDDTESRQEEDKDEKVSPGIRYLLYLASMSVVIGAFNLLPLMPLDSGKLVFALALGLAGETAAAVAVWVGYVLLGLFFLTIVVHDTYLVVVERLAQYRSYRKRKKEKEMSP